MLEGSYGFGVRPLAYGSRYSSVACSEKPVRVNLKGRLGVSVKRAKDQGCAALLATIVSSIDGRILAPEQWKAITNACRETGLILIIDKAMTAIRCGTPFAYQHPDYQNHGRPDLILFGKGIKTNGIAIDWQGFNIQRMNFVTPEDRVDVVNGRQFRYTASATPGDLLQSWGTIELAREQQWPQRAKMIGENLRSILIEYGFPHSSISGLHALIWFRPKNHDRAIKNIAVVSASSGERFTRWLSVMDPLLTSWVEVKTKVFGLESLGYGKALAIYLAQKDWWVGQCSQCGKSMETGDDREGAKPRCMLCVNVPCIHCEPEEHKCPMSIDIS